MRRRTTGSHSSSAPPIGGFLIYVISKSGDLDKTGVFAANGWGIEDRLVVRHPVDLVVEIVFTAS